MVDWKSSTAVPHSLPTPPDSQHPHQYPGPHQHHIHHPAAPRGYPHPASTAAPPPSSSQPHPPPGPPPQQPNVHQLPPPRYAAAPYPYDHHHRPADSPDLVKHSSTPTQYRPAPEAQPQHDSPDHKPEHQSGHRRASATRHPADHASPLTRTRTYPPPHHEQEASPRPLPNRDTHSAQREMEYYPPPHATPLLEHMREQHHHMHHPPPPGHGPPPAPPHLDTAVGPSYGPHSQPQSAPPYGPQSYPYSSYDAANLESSQKRKAVRASQACDNCRAKKAKCDENRPCGNCANQNIQCNFRDMPAPKQERSMMQLSEQVNGLGRRMETIESLLYKIAGNVDSDMSSPPVDRSSRDRNFTPEGFAGHSASTVVPNHGTNHSLSYGRVEQKMEISNGPSPHWNHSESSHSTYLSNGHYPMQSQERVNGQRQPSNRYEDTRMSYEEPYESELSREVARRGQDAHEDMLSKDYLNGSVALAPIHRTAANHLIDWPSIAPFFAGIADRDYVKHGEYHHHLDLRQRPRRCDRDSRAISNPASPGQGEHDDSSTISNTSDGRPAMAFVRQGGEGSRGTNPTPGGRNPRDQSLSIDSDISFRLLNSYFKHIHILQPFMNREHTQALVQDFVHSYYFEPTYTSSPMEHSSSQGSAASAKRRKVAHSFNSQKRNPNAKIPIARTVENAVVLLIFALGKVCEHEGPLPALIGESKIVPQGTPLPEGVRSTPYKNIPNMIETWHPNFQDENFTRTDQHSSDPYSPDIDRIPGLAYYVHAAQILGEIHGDNSLVQVHARLLAGLYLGQLVRVNESWQWIKAACDAWQMLFKQRNEMIELLHYDEKTAFWACLMLESDILAEHDCIPSGISKWEDAFTANDDTLLKMDINNPAEEERYCFFVQGIIRSILNRVHSALYVADEDKEKNSEWQKLSSEDYLNQLEKWRNSLPLYLTWRDYETPANSINRARLRGKYYGARYLICRPYLRQILDPSFKNVKPHNDESDLKVQHANKTNDISYARECVDAARKSTLAFDSVPGMKRRLIVTNPFGTAQAQFSNVIVLSAAYCADHLTGFIQEQEILFYIDRTRDFLSTLAPLCPTMHIDIQILDNTRRIVMSKAQTREMTYTGSSSVNNSFHN